MKQATPPLAQPCMTDPEARLALNFDPQLAAALFRGHGIADRPEDRPRRAG